MAYIMVAATAYGNMSAETRTPSRRARASATRNRSSWRQWARPTASAWLWWTRTPAPRPMAISSSTAGSSVSLDPRTCAVNSPSAAARSRASPSSSSVGLNIPGG